MWLPTYDEEWDGDLPLSPSSEQELQEETGKVVFRGDTLPWKEGTYEFRYHHDGKYNVMCVGGPLEVLGMFFLYFTLEAVSHKFGMKLINQKAKLRISRMLEKH